MLEYVRSGDYWPPAAPDYGAGYGYRHEERVVSPRVHRAPAIQTPVRVNVDGMHAVNHSNGVSQSATKTIIVHPQPVTTTPLDHKEKVEYGRAVAECEPGPSPGVFVALQLLTNGHLPKGSEGSGRARSRAALFHGGRRFA